ncbi:MAG: hypothetical protein ABR589_00160 [Chthoniobacterales bacterium]
MADFVEADLRKLSVTAGLAVTVCAVAIPLMLSGCGKGNSNTAQRAEPTPDSPVSRQSAASAQTPAGASPSAAQQPQGGPQTRATSGQRVEYDTLIEFTEGGNSDALKVSGWSIAEAGFTWTEGTAAMLSLRVPPADSPVTLKMKAAGSIKEPEVPFQPVEIDINDEKIADLQVGNTAEFSVPVPEHLTKSGGVLTIALRTPKAASPKDLGLNEDARVLGIRVFNIALSTVQ